MAFFLQLTLKQVFYLKYINKVGICWKTYRTRQIPFTIIRIRSSGDLWSAFSLFYLFLDIFIRFGMKLCRQIVGIPMGTNCAPLVADLILLCYERDCMTSLFDDDQADIIEVFNSTSRYFNHFLYIDNPYFEGMVNQIIHLSYN